MDEIYSNKYAAYFIWFKNILIIFVKTNKVNKINKKVIKIKLI